MDIKKLLFVTQFEELWFDALQSLLDLRKASLDHVVLLNVIEREKVSMRRGTGYQKNEEIKLREKANIRFIDWAEYLFEQGMEVGCYIVVGGMVPHVISSTKKEEADLIVIGLQKKSKLKQFYSGSDIMEIIRGAETPVLVYKYMQESGEKSAHPFERPLLVTDFSPAVNEAVEYLKPLKDIIREIHLIHVADEKSLTGHSAMAVQKTRKVSRQKLEEICDIFEAEGIVAKPHVYVGDRVAEIEKGAKDCKASVIVCGASGKAAWKEKWVGSTPKALAEKSAFPTLLIPPPGKS
ncbi:MAG: universal stress protein [Desulfobacterales bacterium]|nr:universal stress protein [Desulfobacterales bacterium]